MNKMMNNHEIRKSNMPFFFPLPRDRARSHTADLEKRKPLYVPLAASCFTKGVSCGSGAITATIEVKLRTKDAIGEKSRRFLIGENRSEVEISAGFGRIKCRTKLGRVDTVDRGLYS